MFKTKPHPDFPKFYDQCENTGACFFKPAKQREYTDSYFIEEYKNQYNKTYYEDEPALRALAKNRLSLLKKYTDGKKLKILEIGSAAGFFLDEARLEGHSVLGIEISKTESEYANKVLGVSTECKSFLEFTSTDKFDCIAAFFVLEHFPDQEKMWQKIFSLLNGKGFIFLALPSLNGPTYTTNPDEWFKTHPEDHFVDYSPESLKEIFHSLHADVLFAKPMSYHPSRDRGLKGQFPLKYFYKQIANILSYGDTLQLLARKR